jgi:hypothetical protein
MPTLIPQSGTRQSDHQGWTRIILKEVLEMSGGILRRGKSDAVRGLSEAKEMMFWSTKTLRFS